MIRSILRIFGAVITLTALGCGSQKGWEISVENQSDFPCSVEVIMGQDQHRTAKIDNLTSKKTEIMIGEKPDNILRTIKVTHANGQQELPVDAHLTAGKIYKIILDKEGRIQGSLRDQ